MMVDLKGYEGKYKINECGNIINKRGHAMRAAMTETGYLRVALEEKGNTDHRKNEFVHRLVAKTFLENDDPVNKNIVMHLDNDPLNNHVSNLRWGTQAENIQQAFNENRKRPPMKFTKHLHLYEVYNEDTGDVVQCYGRQELSELIQYREISLKNMIGNDRLIYLGPYAGYKMRRIKGEERVIKRAFIPIKEIRDQYKQSNHS